MYSYIKTIGNSVYLTKYENSKKKYIKDSNFKPYIFVDSKKDTGYKTFIGNNNVSKIEFDSINEMKKNSYPKEHVHGNIGRGLIELEKIRKDKLGDDYDLKNIEVFYLDIEVFSIDCFPDPNKANHQITAITIKSKKTERNHIWALTDEFNTLNVFKKNYKQFSKYDNFSEIERLINSKKFKNKYEKTKKNLKDEQDDLNNKINCWNILKRYLKTFKQEITNDIDFEISELKRYIDGHPKFKVNNETKDIYIQKYVDKLRKIIVTESEYEIVDIINEDDKIIIEYEKRLKDIKKILKTKYNLYYDFNKFRNADVRLYESETDMLNNFVEFIGSSGVDVITGWNLSGFDLPYIYNRGKKLLGRDIKKMSPFGFLLNKTEKLFNGDKIDTCEIVGINCLDYIKIYKNFIQGGRESFSLDFTANDLLGENKLDYDGNLNDLWLNDKETYIEYNIHDADLVYLIDQKTGYIDLLHSLCYYALSPIESYSSNTFLWTSKLFNILLDNNLVLPSKNVNEEEEIPGAFVYEPVCKKHGYTISFDLASLYPSLIRKYNLSHECLIDTIPEFNKVQEMIDGDFDFTPWKEQNCCVLPLGSIFSKEKQGLIPKQMELLFNLRKKHKKESSEYYKLSEKTNDFKEKENYLHLSKKLYNIQYAEKILLNSLYGAFLFKNFILFKKEIGESITSAGQVSNLYCSKRINEFLNSYLGTENIDYIIGGDTDSFYINAQPFVDKLIEKKNKRIFDYQIVKYLDNISQKLIEPKIKEIYQEMFEKEGAFENTMLMEREIIADCVIWTAKKKYACRVLNSEGKCFLDKPDIKYVGIQIKRSDTPGALKKYLKEAVNKIFDNEDIDKYIDEVEEKVKQLKIEEIAIPKGMNDKEKYEDNDGWIKGCPMQVRASIIHNNLVDKLGLNNKIKKIKSGDKIKMIPLKLPNITNQDVIAFDGEHFPEEFHLEDFFDRECLFQKTFIKVIDDLLIKIGEERKDGYEMDSFLNMFN